MSPVYHPQPDELVSYAAGTSPEWLSLLIACHATLCPECRDAIALCNAVGGELLDGICRETSRPETLVAPEPPQAEPPVSPVSVVMPDPCLPLPLARYFTDTKPRWRFLAPGVQHIPLSLQVNGNKVRVVRFKPGYVIPEHRHAGDEALLIFHGSIGDSLSGRRFGVGDVCWSNEGTIHLQDVGPEEPCISLTVNVGPPVPMTWTGRVLKKIARL